MEGDRKVARSFNDIASCGAQLRPLSACGCPPCPPAARSSVTSIAIALPVVGNSGRSRGRSQPPFGRVDALKIAQIARNAQNLSMRYQNRYSRSTSHVGDPRSRSLHRSLISLASTSTARSNEVEPISTFGLFTDLNAARRSKGAGTADYGRRVGARGRQGAARRAGSAGFGLSGCQLASRPESTRRLGWLGGDA